MLFKNKLGSLCLQKEANDSSENKDNQLSNF